MKAHDLDKVIEKLEGDAAKAERKSLAEEKRINAKRLAFRDASRELWLFLTNLPKAKKEKRQIVSSIWLSERMVLTVTVSG